LFLFAQKEAKKMEYDLVFEGGGAKGMVFAGAMQEFEARNHTYKRLLGTSAGAITAALLAAGYSSQEMLEAMSEKVNGRSVFTDFLAQPGPFERAQILKSILLVNLNSTLPNFEKLFVEKFLEWFAAHLSSPYSFIEFGGWYSADKFVQWLEHRMDSGINHGKPRHYSAMSLAQFYNETQSDLSVVASDTTAGQMLVLNHRTAPDVPLVWAVRMSMSIPLLWQEVIWRPEWGKYLNQDMANHAIVDGGLLSNFPIELFVSKDEDVKSLMGVDSGDRVLGMLIDESGTVEGLQVAAAPASKRDPVLGAVVQRFENLLNTSLSARDKMVIDAYEELVVRLPVKGYGTIEFDMPDEKRALLVNAGCEAMQRYFDQPAAKEDGAVSFDIQPGMSNPAVEVSEQAKKHADKTARRILQPVN
jgi:NTE family protein